MRRRTKFGLPNSSLEISIFSDMSRAEVESGDRSGWRRLRTDLHSERSSGKRKKEEEEECGKGAVPFAFGYLSTPCFT